MCHFHAEGFSFFADAAHHVSDDSSEAILCTFFPHNVLSLFPMSDISLSLEGTSWGSSSRTSCVVFIHQRSSVSFSDANLNEGSCLEAAWKPCENGDFLLLGSSECESTAWIHRASRCALSSTSVANLKYSLWRHTLSDRVKESSSFSFDAFCLLTWSPDRTAGIHDHMSPAEHITGRG